MRGDIPKAIIIMVLAFLVPFALFYFGVGAFFEWLIARRDT